VVLFFITASDKQKTTLPAAWEEKLAQFFK
jgi:hypothetical protein